MPKQPDIDTPPLPGDVVGSYTLQSVLGVGGMATVYRAVDNTGRRVALKILHPGKAGTDDARRFQREFLTLRELRDPHVVTVFEAGVQGDYPWIAMELIDGTDLGTLVEQWEHQPPPDRFALVEGMFRGLCIALDHVHAAGLIHRDIKPSNVLVSRDGRAMLTDFGVVKAPGQFTTQLTMAGRLVGTIAFMAPEQITAATVDSRVDLYSLGAVLYVMLTGQRPIQADSIAGYLGRHLSQRPTPPRELNPQVPSRLEDVCMTLLRKDPSQRYASAQQVIAALDAQPGSDRLPVHGREDELASLMLRINQANAGAGGVLFLIGPPGSGKSTLLSELVFRVQTAGRDVAVADGGQADALSTLRQQLSSSPAGSQPLLPADDGSSDELGQLADGRPWTVVIDHLDQLSSSQLNSLTRIVRRRVAIHGEPLLLVGAIEHPRGRAAGLVSGAETGLSPELLQLGPLDSAAVTAMLRDRGLTGSAAAVLAQRLTEEAGGLPGAIVEQLTTLTTAGWLTDDSSGQLSPVLAVDRLRDQAMPVPARVAQQELDRLGRLAPATRTLAESLAILAVETTLRRATELASLDAAAAGVAVERLRDADMVTVRHSGLDELLQLSSSRLSNVIVDQLEPAQRTALHRKAASLLAGRSRRRPDNVDEDIIRHLLGGGRVAAAYPLILAGARWRLAAGHAEAAARLLRQAAGVRVQAEQGLDEAQRRRHATTLWTLQGETALRQGELTESQGAWTRALREAEGSGDEVTVARARGGVGLVLAARTEYNAALPRLQRAVDNLPPGDPMWVAVAQALADTQLNLAQVDDARLTWQKLLDVGDATGSDRTCARARTGLALCQVFNAPPDDATAALERAAHGLRVLESQADLPPILLRLAHLHVNDGRLHDAHRVATEAELLATAQSDVVTRIHALALSATALAAMGTVGEARQIAQEAAAMARGRDGLGNSHLLAALLPLGRVLSDLGCGDQARDLLPPLPEDGWQRDASAQSHGRGHGHAATTLSLQALWARLMVDEDPGRATSLAWSALDTTVTAPPHEIALLALDAAHTLRRARAPGLVLAIERVRRSLPPTGARLLHLDCAHLAAAAGLAEPSVLAADRIRQALDHELNAQGRLAERWSS